MTALQRKRTWLAGLVVAGGAAVLTAHGLIEVALGCGVPAWFGWLYPVITDGLALVAYTATTDLAARTARAYAWSVVVLAAGLSGLAQASYLAGGVDQAPGWLRFVIGAWPAIAAAIAAHLLYLIGKDHPHTTPAAEPGRVPVGAYVTGAERTDSTTSGLPGVQRRQLDPAPMGLVGQTTSAPPSNQPGVQPTPRRPTGGVSNEPDERAEPFSSSRSDGMRRALAPIDRALAAAELYRRQHDGELPSARDLAQLSGASRGTAATALKQLRENRHGLHVINTESSECETRANQ